MQRKWRLSRKLKKLAQFPRRYVDYRPIKVPMIRRGTSYGGWWFSPTGDLRGGLVVCAGAGEDVSFDVALAAEYGVTVHIIDPTPRAVEHVQAVITRIGRPAEADFGPGGNQSPAAYDLSGVESSQLVFHPFALWDAEEEVNFFPPKNSEHVSHTVGNWRQTPWTERVLTVRGRRLSTILPPQDGQIALMKMDIEGSEIEVIADLLSMHILPHQLLVEFDQLATPSLSATVRAKKTFVLLKKHGYRLARREGLNFSFIRF